MPSMPQVYGNKHLIGVSGCGSQSAALCASEDAVIKLPGQNRRKDAGFSLLELVVVILIVMIVAGMVIPSVMQTWYDLELRAAGSSVSDLMQRDRILSAKNNQTYPVGYRVDQGVTEV